MFQDLNRKLQHAAEKEKEVPAVDSKVRRVGSALTTTNLTSFSPSLPGVFPVLAVPSQMSTGQEDPEPGPALQVPDCPFPHH